MSWDTSLDELRTLLSDNTQDKPRMRKAVFGVLDGNNTAFQTYEFRRLTDFSMNPAAPLGVYVNGAVVTVAADFPDIGQFTLSAAPQNTDTLEATYYVQWFTDSELNQFLSFASRWIAVGDPTVIPPGLQPACLHYAMANAYEKLSMRYSEFSSESFRLEDGQNPKTKTPSERYQSLATYHTKKAEDLRKQFYTKNDENQAALFATARGCVRDPQPKG